MSGIFLRQGDSFIAMREAPYEAERVLQELLAEHPEVLAGDTSAAAWLLITREAGVSGDAETGTRWSLDHLFVDGEGVLSLVEVKRGSDTRGRREVVAQMLDYAANAATSWTAESLRAWFEAECQKGGKDADEAVIEAFAEVRDPDEYWHSVKTNLAAGKLRLVFVSDAIPPELRRIVEFLNTQMTETEVLAIEVKQYVDADGQRQTIVPTLIGQSEAARRIKTGSPTPRGDSGRLADTVRLGDVEADMIARLRTEEGLDPSTITKQLLVRRFPEHVQLCDENRLRFYRADRWGSAHDNDWISDALVRRIRKALTS
jgi:hypothetical protein